MTTQVVFHFFPSFTDFFHWCDCPPLHIALSLALTLLTGTKPTLSVLHRQPTLYTEPSALPWHWTGYRLWAMPRWVMRYTTRKFLLGFSSDMGSFTKHLQTKRLKDRQLSQQKYAPVRFAREMWYQLFMSDDNMQRRFLLWTTRPG